MNIDVLLSGRDFLRFSAFDTLVRRKIWLRLVIFAGILGFCAALCFTQHQRQGAVLLGTVLAVVALGLPAAWLLNFFLTIRKQAIHNGLGDGKYVYTLNLTPKALLVNNGAQEAEYLWGKLHRAYRRGNATYLYITPQRAFLLPDSCVPEGGAALWAMVEKVLPAERRSGK